MTSSLALLDHIAKLWLLVISLRVALVLLTGEARRQTMFLLLLFAGYKAYGNIFSFCLPSNGGSPWYPSNRFEHRGCCSFCHLYHRCCCPSQGTTGLLLALRPSILNLPRLENTRECDKSAHAASSIHGMLDSWFCSHMWGILNPHLNSLLLVLLATLSLTALLQLPPAQPSAQRSPSLSPSSAMAVPLSISSRFVSEKLNVCSLFGLSKDNFVCKSRGMFSLQNCHININNSTKTVAPQNRCFTKGGTDSVLPKMSCFWMAFGVIVIYEKSWGVEWGEELCGGATGKGKARWVSSKLCHVCQEAGKEWRASWVGEQAEWLEWNLQVRTVCVKTATERRHPNWSAIGDLSPPGVGAILGFG